MAVVIVHHAEFGVVVFAAPLDRLPSVAAFRYATVGGIDVACSDAAAVGVQLTDVFG